MPLQLAWCRNPNVINKTQMKFASIVDGNVVEYSLHTSEFFENKQLKNEYNALLTSLTDQDVLEIEVNSENKIVKCYPSDMRQPYKTQTQIFDNEMAINNYALAVNKFASFSKDKFHHFVSADENPWKTTSDDYDFPESRATFERQIKHLNGIHQAPELKRLNYKVKWRLAIGLGNASVYETGIALHPLYGFPFLPGSGIKGVVRSYIIERVFDKNEKAALKSKLFCYLFGGDKDSYDTVSRQGNFVFYDAYPTRNVALELEVMTPHYSDYYTGNAPPADYHDPVPIPFLVVKKGTKFSFHLGFKVKANTTKGQVKTAISLLNDPVFTNDTFVTSCTANNLWSELGITADCSVFEFLEAWIKLCFTQRGIGAKTATGYGRMIKVIETQTTP